KKNQATEIQRLIEQLGSRKYRQRRAAGRRLDAIGKPALAPLNQAATTSKDPEIRRRGRQLVRAIERRLVPYRKPLLSGPQVGDQIGDLIRANQINARIRA